MSEEKIIELINSLDGKGLLITDKTQIKKEVNIWLYATQALPEEIDVTWGIEDVKEVAEDLTDEECRRVLQLVDHKHDATIGVNWEVLESWADYVRSERGEAIQTM